MSTAMSSPQPAALPDPSTTSNSTSPDWLANFILTAKTITAAAELLPFPYVKGVFGAVVPILEAVQKVVKNQDDFKDLCASIVEIVTMLQEDISRHGDVAASRLKQLCEKLQSLLHDIQQGLGKIQKSQRKGLRSRLKEFTRSSSIGDELLVYKARLNELRTNFTLLAAMNADLNVTKLSSFVQLNIGACFTSPGYHRLPPPSRIFHGRRNILNQMHDYFTWDVGKRHICLLHGLGGSGKTQIALKFLDESTASRFTDIFFIDASTAETINSGLENIAVTRSVGSKAEDASRWLAAHHEEWLLVFDNADNLNLNLHQFFPQSTRGNILITSRNPQLCVHAPGAHHQISNMEEEDAVQLLLTSSAQGVTSENQILATEIVKVLHCLPLAVVQAGAFILKTGALGRYLTLYEQNRTRLLSELPAQSHDKYAWSVYTTWDISFQHLSKPAARFLQLCSFLHHEGISEAIFSHAASYELELLGPSEEQLREAWEFLAHFLTDSGAWDSLCFADMAAEIRGYSLINQDPQTNLFSIHPLVHHWCQTTNSDLHSTRECTAAIIGMSVFGGTELFRIRLLPHLNCVMLPHPLLAHEFPDRYALGLEVLMLEKSQQVLGMEHPNTLTAMANLAATYGMLGKFKDAEQLDVVVLEKQKQILGTEHPDTLTALGKFKDAEQLDVVVLEKRKQILGTEHPNTLTAMANLAATYRMLGKFKDAEQLEVVVLEKQKQILGTEHPDTLTAMANLAATYRMLGKFKDAEQLEVLVLEKRKQILGTEHPDTLTAMGNLAGTYGMLGKFKDAEELQVVVLEQRKQILGTEHPDTLTAMGNLAGTYGMLGKFKDAEELQVVVLEQRKQILGTEHPDTLTAMANLAATYRMLGKFKDAEQLEVVVLEKWKEIFGTEHPDTLRAMGNLAATYCRLGKFKDAEQLEVVVLEQRKQILGTEHPDTLRAIANLAATYRMLRKFKDAEQLEVVVLEKWKRILGTEHPDTLTAMANLAATYYGEELEVVQLNGGGGGGTQAVLAWVVYINFNCSVILYHAPMLSPSCHYKMVSEFKSAAAFILV
ncbi:hypothetical protein B0H10DRAFT_2181414 [Mycena sp. CBHHK59/15]|nr:hypothetical protein B0H10DRAFT_2181414 [Mycena sp. CBHHK59/15]